MGVLDGIGDVIAGMGDIKPDTVGLLQNREKINLEAARQKALDSYNQSQLGLSSARLAATQEGLDIRRQGLNKPHFTKDGQIILPDTSSPSGYKAVSPVGLLSPTPKSIPYASPGGARESALKLAPGIMGGPWTEEVKIQKLMEAGLNAADARLYADKHTEVNSLARKAEQAYLLEEQGKGTPETKQAIKAYEKFLSGGSQARKEGLTQGAFNTKDLAASVAAAITAVQEQAKSGDSFAKWEPPDKDTAFLDKYYSGKDPRFAWGDKRSYTEFNREYYHCMNATGRSPLSAITERADIHSLQGALNDITKREALINSFVDRIEANAQIVRNLQSKYKLNSGRLMNQAQNLTTRGVMGSGDLESLRLALFSLSQEVTKVETGQLGISAPNVTQSEELRRIHDINLDAKDLDKVITTSTMLGHTSKEAMARTRDDIRQRIANVQSPVISPFGRPQQDGTRQFKGKTIYHFKGDPPDDWYPNDQRK